MSLDTSHSSSTPHFPLLALGNYGSWVGNAKAWFMRQGLWGIVSGRSKRPVPADSKALTAAETEGIEAWDDKAEKAAGELYLDDPCKMWKKLESIHLQKCPGARFNAYDVGVCRSTTCVIGLWGCDSTRHMSLCPGDEPIG